MRDAGNQEGTCIKPSFTITLLIIIVEDNSEMLHHLVLLQSFFKRYIDYNSYTRLGNHRLVKFYSVLTF